MLRLGDLYMKIGRYASAKDIYLELCRFSPSATVRFLVSYIIYFVIDVARSWYSLL